MEVNNQENLTTWTIKEALKQKTRPAINLNCVELELVSAKESTIEYIMTIKPLKDILILAHDSPKKTGNIRGNSLETKSNGRP